MEKSKNIESRDYNDIKNTLEFISENINMANLLSEETLKMSEIYKRCITN